MGTLDLPMVEMNVIGICMFLGHLILQFVQLVVCTFAGFEVCLCIPGWRLGAQVCGMMTYTHLNAQPQKTRKKVSPPLFFLF